MKSIPLRALIPSRRVRSFTGLSLLILTSCGQPRSPAPSLVEGYGEAYKEYALWPEPAAIPVCWERFDSPSASILPILNNSNNSHGDEAKSYELRVNALSAAAIAIKWGAPSRIDCHDPDGYVSVTAPRSVWPLEAEAFESDQVKVCWNLRNVDQLTSNESVFPRSAFLPETEPFKLGRTPFLPTAENRLSIATLVTEQYQRAGIGFQGWGLCEEESPGIRIKVDYQGQDFTAQTGALLSGVKGGMHLNWGKRCDLGVEDATCVKNTALHEFGHALGFHHEMNRRDHSACEKDQTEGQGEPAAVAIGLYHAGSIMSYCRDRRELSLSETDVQAFKDYLFAPIARMAGTVPASFGGDTVYLIIEGLNLVAYRSLTTLDPTLCLNPDLYSSPRSVDETLAPDLKDLPFGQRVYVCVLGQDKQGTWQAPGAFSSVSWLRAAP